MGWKYGKRKNGVLKKLSDYHSVFSFQKANFIKTIKVIIKWNTKYLSWIFGKIANLKSKVKVETINSQKKIFDNLILFFCQSAKATKDKTIINGKYVIGLLSLNCKSSAILSVKP